MPLRSRIIIALTIAGSLISASCNTFSSVDQSESLSQVIERAQYMADRGDCAGARDILWHRSDGNDEMYFTLGFAHLCIAGATLSTIGTTLVTYTSSSGTDYSVIGSLARKLLPWDSSKETAVQDAIYSFQRITNTNRKAYSLLLGRLSKLALLVAKSAGSKSTVVRDDISLEANCTSAVACSANGMSDADASYFRDEVVFAASDASSISLAGLKDLSTALNSSFSALAGADAIRYTVRNQVVPAN